MSRLLGGIVGGGYIYIYEMQGIVQTFCFFRRNFFETNLIRDEHIVKKQKPTAKSIDHDNHFAMIPFIYCKTTHGNGPTATTTKLV